MPCSPEKQQQTLEASDSFIPDDSILFFLAAFISFYVYVFFQNICTCAVYSLGSHGSQKRALHLLKLLLWSFVGHPCGCWESDPSPLPEQPVFFTDELSPPPSLMTLESIPAQMQSFHFVLQEASQFSLQYCTLPLESSGRLL